MNPEEIKAQIKEHMEVVGTDSKHVGIVDHLDGDRIKLTHHDSQAGGDPSLPAPVCDHVHR